jgi:hypothetical protein
MLSADTTAAVAKIRTRRFANIVQSVDVTTTGR